MFYRNGKVSMTYVGLGISHMAKLSICVITREFLTRPPIVQ